MMTFPLDRRQWLKTTAAATAAGFVPGLASAAKEKAPSDKLNVAVIGLGAQGKANLDRIPKEDVTLVALCDVDDKRAGDAYERFPMAKKYYDFRKMFDEMADDFDAVVISTPDHTHFHPARQAIALGKHVYLEKPMAHNVWEVRELTKMAAEKKVATQLGVQRHTLPSIHDAVDIIRSGAIGTIKEVHSWVSSSRGMQEIPTDSPPTPDTLKWDLWLGPTTEPRAYSPAFAPYSWRFWWDYGTGEAGNWGCHILDIPFWSLNLTYPTRVEGSGPPVDPERTPKEMHTQFAFPAVGDRPAVTLHWYQGTPGILKELGIEKAGGFNNLFVGEKGMLLAGFDKVKLLPEEKFTDFEAEKTVPTSPGFHKEWITACLGGEPATCDFKYSGPMSETVLLGNVAYRAGGFDWDATNLKASTDAAQALIREAYRPGWEV